MYTLRIHINKNIIFNVNYMYLVFFKNFINALDISMSHLNSWGQIILDFIGFRLIVEMYFRGY